MNAQRELFLPDRPTNEILEERLAIAVSEFNQANLPPERRVELFRDIECLRASLGKERDR